MRSQIIAIAALVGSAYAGLEVYQPAPAYGAESSSSPVAPVYGSETTTECPEESATIATYSVPTNAPSVTASTPVSPETPSAPGYSPPGYGASSTLTTYVTVSTPSSPVTPSTESVPTPEYSPSSPVSPPTYSSPVSPSAPGYGSPSSAVPSYAPSVTPSAPVYGVPPVYSSLSTATYPATYPAPSGYGGNGTSPVGPTATGYSPQPTGPATYTGAASKIAGSAFGLVAVVAAFFL